MSTVAQSPHAQPARPLSIRRGSVSASDPYGVRTEGSDSSPRQLSSRLTILRIVPDDAQGPLGTSLSNDAALSSSFAARRTSWEPSSPSYRRSSLNAPDPRRLSFASSSFSQDRAPPSPQLSISPIGRRRSSTVNSARGHPASLTPQEVFDLARSPVPIKASPRSQLMEDLDAIPLLSPSMTGIQEPARKAKSEQPPIMPIPDSQFLPFVDRPAEVTAFLKTEPTSRLIALLEHAFPPDKRLKRPPPEAQSLEEVPPSPGGFTAALHSALEKDEGPATASEYGDPETWSYETLLDWMCRVPREQADDLTWVRAIQRCVMAHNEQICVNLLAALGVPLEGLDALAGGRQAAGSSLPNIHVSGPDTLGRIGVEQLDEDPFEVEISPILYPQREGVSYAPSDDSESTGSSRSRLSLAMESIDEHEDEYIGESAAETDRDPKSGTSTARAQSPADAGKDAGGPPAEKQAARRSFWPRDGDAGDLHGLCIATSALPAGTPYLSSFRPTASVHASKPAGARTRLKRNSVNVAHVLSGAPGHAGFSWRPGGPLFPMTFAPFKADVPEDAVEDQELSPSITRRDVVYNSRSPRPPNRRALSAQSRSSLIPKAPKVPPNTPAKARSLINEEI